MKSLEEEQWLADVDADIAAEEYSLTEFLEEHSYSADAFRALLDDFSEESMQEVFVNGN